ncbi:MAG TPA: FlgD immunoglobulin-like domain containing protein [Candidatus Acidoferrales bacterium]|nr:FlgD immunoglobulin-like domain containing protein [Candidatus Acidoferrales bacterium]
MRRDMVTLLVAGALLRPVAAIAAWPADSTTNVPVCTAAGDQWWPAVCSDGAGGMYVAWQDFRDSPTHSELFATHVDATGAIVAGWGQGGLMISPAGSVAGAPYCVSDCDSGVVIVWNDGRDVDPGLYVQRLRPTGQALWTPGGRHILSGDAVDLSVTPGPSGTAYFAWTDARNGTGANPSDLYVGAVDSSGNCLWPCSGLAVCTAPGVQVEAAIAARRSGGAVAAWSDGRDSSGIYVQAVTAAGTTLWTTDGVAASETLHLVQWPVVVDDGADGAFVAWTDVGSGLAAPIVFVQHITSGGAADPLWPAGGMVVTASGKSGTNPWLVSEPDGGVLVAWQAAGNPGESIQYLSSAGVARWSQPVGVVGAARGGPWSRFLSDGSGGVFLVWEESYTGLNGQAGDLYAQHVLADGSLAWPGPVAVSTAAGEQYDQAVTTDDAGGILVAWQDERGADSDIYAQNVQADGTLGGQVVAVLMSLASVDASDGRIAIAWSVSATVGSSVTVERRTTATAWSTLQQVVVDGTGMVRLSDTDVVAGTQYGYRLVMSSGGKQVTGGETWASVPVNVTLRLETPSPNPSSEATTIRYSLPASVTVRLSVFDLSGRVVRHLMSGEQDTGSHALVWDGRGDAGEPMRAGLYLVRLDCALGRRSKEVILLR